jgi:hypothetical protein
LKLGGWGCNWSVNQEQKRAAIRSARCFLF